MRLAAELFPVILLEQTVELFQTVAGLGQHALDTPQRQTVLALDALQSLLAADLTLAHHLGVKIVLFGSPDQGHVNVILEKSHIAVPAPGGRHVGRRLPVQFRLDASENLLLPPGTIVEQVGQVNLVFEPAHTHGVGVAEEIGLEQGAEMGRVQVTDIAGRLLDHAQKALPVGVLPGFIGGNAQQGLFVRIVLEAVVAADDERDFMLAGSLEHPPPQGAAGQAHHRQDTQGRALEPGAQVVAEDAAVHFGGVGNAVQGHVENTGGVDDVLVDLGIAVGVGVMDGQRAHAEVADHREQDVGAVAAAAQGDDAVGAVPIRFVGRDQLPEGVLAFVFDGFMRPTIGAGVVLVELDVGHRIAQNAALATFHKASSTLLYDRFANGIQIYTQQSHISSGSELLKT